MSHVDNDFVLKYKNICYKPPKVEEDDSMLGGGISVVCSCRHENMNQMN